MAKDYDEKAAEEMARKFGANATAEDIENVRNNMDKMNRGPLKAVWDKVVTMWKAFLSPDSPAYLKAIIIGSLIYMVSPLDLIPDVIPVVGLVDDVGVVGLGFSQLMRFLGTTAITGATAYAIVKIVHLTRQALRKEALKRNAKAMSAKINEIRQNNGYKKVSVGLYDENNFAIDSFEIESETVDSSIHKGDVIQLFYS